MTQLRRRMIEDMQLRGYAWNTQRSYLACVRSLAKYCRKPPDQVDEEDIRRFFLYLINEKKRTGGTVSTHLTALKFLYEKTLKREWPILDFVRPKKESKLPVVLSTGEVRSLLSRVAKPAHRMALTTIYSCGLRLSEGTHLKVDAIDSDRMLVHIRGGKGRKDRYVPLPKRTLELLREYWLMNRPQPFLFPGSHGQQVIPDATLQRTFRIISRESEIRKSPTIHTLRHSYATHLLESGVNLRFIQEILGHTSPRTTALYTHLTRKGIETAMETIERLMADL
jgi:integrase/recombinase XerD